MVLFSFWRRKRVQRSEKGRALQTPVFFHEYVHETQIIDGEFGIHRGHSLGSQSMAASADLLSVSKCRERQLHSTTRR
jgi:hypothetical protein